MCILPEKGGGGMCPSSTKGSHDVGEKCQLNYSLKKKKKKELKEAECDLFVSTFSMASAKKGRHKSSTANLCPAQTYSWLHGPQRESSYITNTR